MILQGYSFRALEGKRKGRQCLLDKIDATENLKPWFHMAVGQKDVPNMEST